MSLQGIEAYEKGKKDGSAGSQPKKYTQKFNRTPYAFGTQTATVESTTPMQFGSGQLSYELDTMNLFTFSFNRRFGRPESNTIANTDNYDADMKKLFAYTQVSSQTQSWGSTDFGVDYQHSFKKKGEILTLSYKLSNTPNNSNYVAENIINSLYLTQPQPGLTQWIKLCFNCFVYREASSTTEFYNRLKKQMRRW